MAVKSAEGNQVSQCCLAMESGLGPPGCIGGKKDVCGLPCTYGV